MPPALKLFINDVEIYIILMFFYAQVSFCNAVNWLIGIVVKISFFVHLCVCMRERTNTWDSARQLALLFSQIGLACPWTNPWYWLVKPNQYLMLVRRMRWPCLVGMNQNLPLELEIGSVFPEDGGSQSVVIWELFLFLEMLKVWTQASCLLGRHSPAWATPPAPLETS